MLTAMPVSIVGRDAELAVIQAFLDRREAGPRALVLEGEAGIGKSTVWLAGVAAARERSLRVLTSRPAEAERTLAHVVLGDLFGDVEPEALAALPVPRRRAFEAALLREEADPFLGPRALGVAIQTLVSLLTADRPLLLAIDDDQWADASSMAALEFALRRLDGLPVVCLLSRRIDGGATTTLEEALDPMTVQRLVVGPLSLGATQLLLRQRLGIVLARPSVLRIHEASGGNPFYALELAGAQAAAPDRDATTLVPVPRTLERLVEARLGALDTQTRQALLLIAAHGRYPAELLRAMEVAPVAVDQARRANVIETSEGLVRFTHPLLASAVYQGATDADRRAAHRRLATVVVDPIHRGRHVALGADKSDADLSAFLERAASVARDRAMPISAAELWQHALRLTPPEDLADRHRRTMATARGLAAAGEGQRARAIAADLAASSPAGPRRAEALVLRSELEPPGIAVDLLRDALAEAAGVPRLLAEIHGGLASAGKFSFTKPRAWAERHARASLRLAERLDDDALRARALSILALLRFDRRDPHALELAERAYGLATTVGDPQLVLGAARSIGHLLTWIGRTDQARDWLERQLAAWGDRDEEMRSDVLWYLALVELWAGRWDVASEYAEQSREISVQYGQELPVDSLPAALIALHRGQLERARELARHAISIATGQEPEPHTAILAMADLWSGDPTSALPAFIRAERRAASRGLEDPSMRAWRAEYIEALLQLGRTDDAARLIAEWETAAKPLGRERVLAQALRCRGLLAAALGDLSAAIDLFEAAVERHAAAGDPFGRARALLALGATRRRMRQKRLARGALEDALAGFETLGADGWAATTRAELARIGGRQRLEGLSPSELSVATLVVAGRTNREIASALFLGERTVGGHLTRIYAKLGVRSRTELARKLPQLRPNSSDDAGKVEGF